MKYATSNTRAKYATSASFNIYRIGNSIKRIFKCIDNYQSPWWDYWKGFMDFLWQGLNYQNVLISSFIDRRKIYITNRDFVTNYIPESSTAIFKLQSDADLIADDTDNLWFDIMGNQRSVINSNLYTNDYNRTAVKFSHSAPYDISAIGILKNGIVLSATQNNMLHKDFELWLFWAGTLNEYGFIKSNRTIT